MSRWSGNQRALVLLPRRADPKSSLADGETHRQAGRNHRRDVRRTTKWPVMRNWGIPRRAALEPWLAARRPIAVTHDVARTWGEISGYAEKRGRPRPVNDLDRGLLPRLRSAAGDAERERLQDFVDHEGLVLITA